MIILIVGTLIGVSIAYMRYKGPKQEIKEAENEPEIIEYEYNVPDEKGRYIHDVAYDDASDVSEKALTYPFKKSDSYVPNKELVNDAPALFFEYAQDFAKEYIQGVYGTGYRAIGEDESGYVTQMLDFYNPTYTFCIGGKDNLYAEEILNDTALWIKENEVQVDIDVKTAGYLVYKDVYFYIRGEMDITPYNCNTEIMPYFIQGFDVSKEGKYIFEIGCSPSINNKKAFNVMTFKILGDA